MDSLQDPRSGEYCFCAGRRQGGSLVDRVRTQHKTAAVHSAKENVANKKFADAKYSVQKVVGVLWEAIVPLIMEFHVMFRCCFIGQGWLLSSFEVQHRRGETACQRARSSVCCAPSAARRTCQTWNKEFQPSRLCRRCTPAAAPQNHTDEARATLLSVTQATCDSVAVLLVKFTLTNTFSENRFPSYVSVQ